MYLSQRRFLRIVLIGSILTGMFLAGFHHDHLTRMFLDPRTITASLYTMMGALMILCAYLYFLYDKQRDYRHRLASSNQEKDELIYSQKRLIRELETVKRKKKK